MSKSIKLSDNNYLDSSSISHSRISLDKYLDGIRYTMSSTIGWKRIAQFNGMSGGTILLESDTPYGVLAKIEVSCGAGWNSQFNKNFKIITNDNYFTKARIVRKGNSISYLELYQAVAQGKTFRIKALDTINLTIYTSETMGAIPDGYVTNEYDF